MEDERGGGDSHSIGLGSSTSGEVDNQSGKDALQPAVDINHKIFAG